MDNDVLFSVSLELKRKKKKITKVSKHNVDNKRGTEKKKK